MHEDLENPHIKQAIEDSQLLLDYLVSQGDDINHSTIDAIVKASRAYSEGKLLSPGEISLWIAFNQLSKAASPATAETVRYSREQAANSLLTKKERWTVESSLVGKYRTVAIAFLLSFILANGYWIAVTSSLANLKSAYTKIDKLTGSARDNAAVEVDTADKSLLLLSFGLPDLLNFISASAGNPLAEKAAKVRFLEIFMGAVAAAVYSFILPLIAGGLGASVYIVRSISGQIQRAAFSPKYSIRYSLRIYLGSISGLLVSQLFLGNVPEVSKAISPIALAFIMGYSVELFFTLLDRIVSALSSNSSQRNPKA